MKTEETTTAAAQVPKAGSVAPPKARASKKTAESTTRKASKLKPKKRAGKTKTASPRKQAVKSAAGKEQVRSGTKKEIVLELLRRQQGVTMAEIAKATDWKNHSIRGFVSGNVSKKMGLTVQSSRNEAGERTYRLAK